MESKSKYHGSLVAFEGPSDTVFTQLQLLPISSQILALPSLDCYIDKEIPKTFTPRSYIRRIHEATESRHREAIEFLEEATPDGKRLVFLQGGAASAVAQCISSISEHETQGDTGRAESIFKDIVRDGLDALMKDDVLPVDNTISSAQDEAQQDEGQSAYDSLDLEDPTIKAMKAADALDKETANLQPVNGFDFGILSRPRSLSVPAYRYSSNFNRESAVSTLGTSQQTESTATPSILAASSIGEVDNDHFEYSQGNECSYQSPRESLNFGGCFPQPSDPPGYSGKTYETATPDSIHVPSLGSPLSDASLSPPATPTGVIFGEARVIKMRVSRTEGDLTRTRSLDDLSMYGKKARSTNSLTPIGFSPVHDFGSNGRPYSSIGLQNTNRSLQSQSGYSAVHKGTILRASKTIVRRSPTVLNRIKQLARSNYVDRGTDAENPGSAVTEDLDGVREEKFKPVFPMLEDLVVHFTSDRPAELLDHVVQAYKDGLYPLTQLFTSSAKLKELGTSPQPRHDGNAFLPTPGSSVRVQQPLDERVSAQDNASDYDPFAAHGSYGNLTPSSSQYGASVYSQTEKAGQQTDSSHTPPPTPPEPESKFHVFSIIGHGTVVAIQNALRSVLAIYFPSKEHGYHRYAFLLFTEMDDPWKPAFGEQPPRRGANRTDLILGIGAQEGVKREYLLGVTKQLEKLGEKPNGYTRSGRLDLRYLLARVMQDFTRQPLTRQAVGHPFRDLRLLVAWLIPQLEMWLHTNMGVRFLLIEYTPEHLGTVLALREFIGDHMFKVAGIIDTNDKIGHFPKRPDSSGSSNNKVYSAAPGAPNSGPASFDNPSFSKANYLLTCSATESEAAIFTHSIWKHLIRGSQFYIPQGPAYPRSPKAKTPSPPPPLPSQASSIIKQYSSSYASSSYETSAVSSTGTGTGVTSPPLSPAPQYTQRPPSPTASVTSKASAVETVRTARTGRSMHSAVGATRRGRADAQSILTVDLEDDGDLVPDERRLMPRFAQVSERPKPSSKKALKMLGLA